MNEHAPNPRENAAVAGAAARFVSAEEQHEVTSLCAQAGLLLLQHGAESALVESVARRLGLALGMEAADG